MKTISVKNSLLFLLAFFLALFAVTAPRAAIIPGAASSVGFDLDRQAAERLGLESPMPGFSLSVTTPVDLNSLEVSNALARQMQEELARWFVQSGYEVHEIRKGRNILFEPQQGEMLLTRRQRLLGNTKVNSTAIVSGTYTVTPRNVRFNIRIVATGNREVLGMSSVTIPINAEIAALLKVSRVYGDTRAGGALIEPTVVTLLP